MALHKPVLDSRGVAASHPHALSRRWDVETRGAEPQQQALRRTFLSKIEFPEQARVLEVGCGTGVLTRQLARWPGVGSVLGVTFFGHIAYASLTARKHA